MRAQRTFGEVKVGHIITYGTKRLKITSSVPLAGTGQMLVSGHTMGGVRATGATGATFRAGVLREVVIHNWEG